jgi:predicted nucleic acid-binding protein
VNIVDTSGWIEYFFDGENADIFAPLLEDTRRLAVPVICIYEVYKKISLVADEAKALRAIAQMKLGRVIDVTETTALNAAKLSLDYKIPMADSLILAIAQTERAVLWTQDVHFKGLPGVEYREKKER